MPEPRDLAAEAAEIAAALGEGWTIQSVSRTPGLIWLCDRNERVATYNEHGGGAQDAMLLHLARRNAELERERDEARAAVARFQRDVALIRDACRREKAERDTLRARVAELEADGPDDRKDGLA